MQVLTIRGYAVVVLASLAWGEAEALRVLAAQRLPTVGETAIVAGAIAAGFVGVAIAAFLPPPEP
jgi:hypothetical protein